MPILNDQTSSAVPAASLSQMMIASNGMRHPLRPIKPRGEVNHHVKTFLFKQLFKREVLMSLHAQRSQSGVGQQLREGLPGVHLGVGDRAVAES